MQEEPRTPPANRSFPSYIATQALGAFNDNVFKQVVLLLAVGHLAFGMDFQALVQLAFALPFLLFSGLAGELADRFSKGRLMVLCKVAEIGVMVAGSVVFLVRPAEPLAFVWLLAAVTFLMGSQSAFFGPPKYGGLPELVRPGELAPATGLVQMTTFLAIIFGTATAGVLLDALGARLWIAGAAAVAIAVLGTVTSLGIARVPAMDPERRIGMRSFLSIVPTLVRIFRGDRVLFLVFVVYSWFWLVGGVCLTAINALGRLQLGLTNFETSLLVAVLSVGIAAGSVVVGRLSRGGVRIRLIVPGLAGMVLCLVSLVLLPAHAPTAEEIDLFARAKSDPDAAGAIIPVAPAAVRAVAFAVMFLLGSAAGFFSVPLLAFIQARPIAEAKGQVFAASNWFNWIFILASAGVYGVGMSIGAHRAHLVMAALGVVTAAVGLLLVPPILVRLDAEAEQSEP